MDTIPGYAAALEAVRGIVPRWRDVSDEELLAEGAELEAVGRVLDARRAGWAAEVDARSRKRLGEDGLAFRFGQRDGANLVASVARISLREAHRRVAVGVALAPRWSLLADEPLPAKLPVLSAAFHAGQVGIDAAYRIADMLKKTRKRATAEDLDAAEVALTGLAAEADAEIVAIHAASWRDALDPGGPEPSEHDRHQRRLLRLHDLDEWGGSRFSGYLPAEDRAALAALLAARRRNAAMTKREAGDEDVDGLGPEWRELDGAQRTAGQFDYDTAYGTLTSGIRADATGHGGTVKSTPEVIVTVTASVLEARAGRGWIAGVLTPIPVPEVERILCSADVRLQVTGVVGEVLHHGRARRRFTNHQRRAIIAAAGGCQWPGCTAPPGWCDVHHAAWFVRDDGPTDVDNGVLLCSFHHHLIHADNCRWRILIHDSAPYLVPRRWEGDPDPAHRMQRHPSQRAPHPPDTDDPWNPPRRQ